MREKPETEQGNAQKKSIPGHRLAFESPRFSTQREEAAPPFVRPGITCEREKAGDARPCPLIDLDYIDELTRGQPFSREERLRGILALFAEHTPRECDRLNECIREADLAAAEEVSHRLLHAVRSLGKGAAESSLEKLREAVQLGDLPCVKGAFLSFARRHQEVLEEVKAYLNSRPNQFP
jgi:hypothetical protein